MYVAPQPRGSKKESGKARESTDVGQVSSLKPVENAKSQALEQLKQMYGERLRVAVDSEVSRGTLAGPHAKVRLDHFVRLCTAHTFAVYNAVSNGLHDSAARRTR